MPKIKLKNAIIKPAIDIKNKGRELNPINPLKPIFNDPKNLLYLPFPANLSTRSYYINVCLKPTKATMPLRNPWLTLSFFR